MNSARNLRQLHTSTANVSGMCQAIDKRKTALSTTMPSTFNEEKLVNFGPLTKKVYAANVYSPKMNTERAVQANAIAFPGGVATSGISTP